MHWNFNNELRFFVFDPEGDGFSYFKTEVERDEYSEQLIKNYLDDAWDENVIHVLGGTITHRATEIDRTERPDETEIDEEDYDLNGNYWGEHEYQCNFKLLPLEGTCLKCNKMKNTNDQGFCNLCDYPGIQSDHNAYLEMINEGHRPTDAALRSGWKSAKEICSEQRMATNQ